MRDEAPLSLSLTHSLPHCRRLARPASAQPIYLSHLLAGWPAWHQMGKYYFFGNRARGRSLARPSQSPRHCRRRRAARVNEEGLEDVLPSPSGSVWSLDQKKEGRIGEWV